MSFELACRVIAGSLSAGSFVYVSLSNPPLAMAGGLLSGAGGFKLSESLCDSPAKEVCHQVYEQFDGPNSGWPEYIASKTAGPPGHLAAVKARCVEEGRYYPTTPANPI